MRPWQDRDTYISPDKAENREEPEKQEKPKRPRKVGYVFAIIFNLIVLYIVNNLLGWGAPFLTRQFIVPLSVLNISIVASVIANLVFLWYDSDWFLAITRTALNIIGVVVGYTFYSIFPFDFSPLASARIVTIIVRVLLIIAIIGSVIGVVVEFSKFIKATVSANRL